MVNEMSRYACQELLKTPKRIACFHGVRRAELKAFVAINVTMGID